MTFKQHVGESSTIPLRQWPSEVARGCDRPPRPGVDALQRSGTDLVHTWRLTHVQEYANPNLLHRVVAYCVSEARDFIRPTRDITMNDSVRQLYVRWIAGIGAENGLLQTQIRIQIRASACDISGAWVAARATDNALSSGNVTPSFTPSGLAAVNGDHIPLVTCLGMTNNLPHPQITVSLSHDNGTPTAEVGYKNSVGLGMLLASLANVDSPSHYRPPRGGGVSAVRDKVTFSSTIAAAFKVIQGHSQLNMRAVDMVQGSRARVVCVSTAAIRNPLYVGH